MRLSVYVTAAALVAAGSLGWLAANATRGAAADDASGADATTASIRDAQESLPAGAEEAAARLAASPRHAEWQTIRAGEDSLRAWVVYPERSDPAPVVIVIHEIFGLSNWIRAVADQLAADGFIAIAPDLLTMKDVPMTADGESDPQVARTVIRELERETVNRYLKAVADWGTALPAATDAYGVVGFCWGGSSSFAFAVADPELGASVVYYGGSPDASTLSTVSAPVLGLYGGDDARVNATVPPADSAMQALGKTFDPRMFDGAGHGFLRQQDGQDGANLRATQQAWPLTVQWFRTHLNADG